MSNKTGKIYEIKNKINGKVYIGQTTRSIDIRFANHKSAETPLGEDIRKYGIDAFEITIIDDNIPKDELDLEETYWIYEKGKSYDLYNISKGNMYMIPIYSKDYKGNVRNYKNVMEAVEYMSREGIYSEYDGGPMNNLKKHIYLRYEESLKPTIRKAISKNLVKNSHTAYNRCWFFAKDHDFLSFVKENQKKRDSNRVYFKEFNHHLRENRDKIMSDDYNPQPYDYWTEEE